MFREIHWRSHPLQAICCSDRISKVFFISSSVRSDSRDIDSSKDNLGMSRFSTKAKKFSLTFAERKPDDFVSSKSL